MTTPVAQAVMDVIYNCWDNEDITDTQMVAAIIQVLVDSVLPEELEPPCGEREPWPQSYQLISDSKWEQRQQTREMFLALAELLPSSVFDTNFNTETVETSDGN